VRMLGLVHSEPPVVKIEGHAVAGALVSARYLLCAQMLWRKKCFRLNPCEIETHDAGTLPTKTAHAERSLQGEEVYESLSYLRGSYSPLCCKSFATNPVQPVW